MQLEGVDIWKLLAGLGLFLFGMFMLEEALKKLSGRALKIYFILNMKIIIVVPIAFL